ncbi:MAG: CoA transferase, partial [Flavobacteriales bacterium]|nr:CoA transferase [Flavobacteriales bacterium]
HLFIDLHEPEGLKKAQRLANDADVIISNYRAGQGEKFGLDYASVCKDNPMVIYAQITGFGDNDSRAAFDVVLQAESGYMFMNGQPDSDPTKMPVALIDVLAAHQLKEGILVALLAKVQKGKGALVAVSLLDAAISSLTNQATNWLMNGNLPQRMGSLHPNIAPYGEILTTSDGKQIVLAIGSEQHFRNLCEVLDLETLKEDARFISNHERVKHRSQLFQLINSKTKELSSAELMTNFAEVNVPAGMIKNMQEVFETKNSKEMLLRDTMTDGSEAIRVSQIAFYLE